MCFTCYLGLRLRETTWRPHVLHLFACVCCEGFIDLYSLCGKPMFRRWPYDRYRSRAEDLSAPSFTLWIAARLGGCSKSTCLRGPKSTCFKMIFFISHVIFPFPTAFPQSAHFNMDALLHFQWYFRFDVCFVGEWERCSQGRASRFPVGDLFPFGPLTPMWLAPCQQSASSGKARGF